MNITKATYIDNEFEHIDGKGKRRKVCLQDFHPGRVYLHHPVMTEQLKRPTLKPPISNRKPPRKPPVTRKTKSTAMKHKSTGLSAYQSCFKSHPPLMITTPKGTFPIYGVSCTRELPPKECDIFIGLDHGMKQTPRRYPWHHGTEFLFPIADMHAPSDKAEFDKLLKYMIKQMEAGKRIHIGCIGGHGRTGLVLSALVKVTMDIEDATTYVRENYCTKAVESSEQVQWLHKHYGIKVVDGTKSGWSKDYGSGSLFDDLPLHEPLIPPKGKGKGLPSGKVQHFTPVASKLGIHGKNANKS